MEDEVQTWLADNGYGRIVHRDSAGGGSISESGQLTLDNHKTLFVKRNDEVAADFFKAEAHGLQTLARCTDLHIPEVIHVADHFILMEDLGFSAYTSDTYIALGQGVARLHLNTRESFGFDMDNYCGATLQLNPVMSDGFAFFAEHRLLRLGIQAYDQGKMTSNTMRLLEVVAGNLSRWIPEQEPVQLHGDLWSGNAHCDRRGRAALIDPACYWGWAEADLAMTQLFGGFTDEFYAAYHDVRPLDPEWMERVPLYNLYHLLNHLLLFGSSYLPRVHSICEYFGGD